MNEDDKVRIGYQAAMGLIAYEGQVIWRAFTSLVAANTGLAAIVGAGIKVFPSLLLAGQILAVAGIIVCFAWILTLRRQFRYYAYWFSWARHFETKYLTPEVQITTVGKTYGEGGTIEERQEIPKVDRFGFFVRSARVEWLMITVACVFLLVHVAVFIASFVATTNVTP